MINILVDSSTLEISANEFILGQEGDVGVEKVTATIPSTYREADLTNSNYIARLRFLNLEGFSDYFSLGTGTIVDDTIVYNNSGNGIELPKSMFYAKGVVEIVISLEDETGEVLYWSSKPSKAFSVNRTIAKDTVLQEQAYNFIKELETAKMDKQPTATEDHLIIFDNEGNSKDSGYSIEEITSGEFTGDVSNARATFTPVDVADLNSNDTMSTQLGKLSRVESALNNKVDKVTGKSLIDDTEITRLATTLTGTASGTNTGDQDLSVLVPKTTTINGKALSSNITIDKTDIGLSNVDNTSDLDKPISTATQTALNNKVDKTTTVNGKALNGDITLKVDDLKQNAVAIDAMTTEGIFEITSAGVLELPDNLGSMVNRQVIPLRVIIDGAIKKQTISYTIDGVFKTAKRTYIDSVWSSWEISELSGTNTGDQDLSGLLEKSFISFIKAWRGFSDNHLIDVSYNSTNRTITLTKSGGIFYNWNGETKQLGTGDSWTSSAHPNEFPEGKLWFLSSTDGTNFYWAETVWDFADIMVSAVYYTETDKFALREPHGIQDLEGHIQAHKKDGTFKLSAGGDITNITLDSTTANDRRPYISEMTINDEDIATVIPAITTNNYTWYRLDGANGDAIFTKDQTEIIETSGGVPYYNQFTGGVWTKTLLTASQAMAVYQLTLPVTSDAESQKYRHLMIMGQDVGTPIIIKALSTADLNLGVLTSILPEGIFTGRYIIKKSGSNWFIEDAEKLYGTRSLQVGNPSGSFLSSVATDGVTVGGNGTPTDPIYAITNVANGVAGLNSKADYFNTGVTTLTNASFTDGDYNITGNEKSVIIIDGTDGNLTEYKQIYLPSTALEGQEYTFTLINIPTNVIVIIYDNLVNIYDNLVETFTYLYGGGTGGVLGDTTTWKYTNGVWNCVQKPVSVGINFEQLPNKLILDTTVPQNDPISGTLSVDTSTDTFTLTGHGLNDNNVVKFSGSLPSPLVDTELYFVVNKTTDTFQVSLTRGGSAVDITTTGSSYTVRKASVLTFDVTDLDLDTDKEYNITIAGGITQDGTTVNSLFRLNNTIGNTTSYTAFSNIASSQRGEYFCTNAITTLNKYNTISETINIKKIDSSTVAIKSSVSIVTSSVSDYSSGTTGAIQNTIGQIKNIGANVTDIKLQFTYTGTGQLLEGTKIRVERVN